MSLKILDPACGSGAFLNQALNFLIAEHKNIDDIITELTGTTLPIFDTDKSILENNLFGVDINEESVEIAQLSLWLRTAKKGRKLSSLNNNIKCGNSLIDDVEVAGDKAFDWNIEFKEIMDNGGFDVVIGNPPYVNLNTFPKQVHNYFEKKFNSIHTGYNDLMYYFLYKGIQLLNKNGIFGVITSNYFIGNEYAKTLRKFLSNHLFTLINFENYFVFKDANIHTTILFAKKYTIKESVEFSTYNKSDTIGEIQTNSNNYKTLAIKRSELNSTWIIADDSKTKLIKKLSEKNILLGEISKIAKGSESGKNNVFTVDKMIINNFNIEQNVLKKCVKNSDIHSYSVSFTGKYLIYTDNNFTMERFPNAYKYLEGFKELLLDRRGPKTGEYEWWRLHRPSIKEVFESKEKILVPYRAEHNRFGYDDNQYFNNGGDVRAIQIIDMNYKTKFIVAILNSSLIDWFYSYIGKPKGKSREYFNKPLSLIPIPNIAVRRQQDLIIFVDLMLNLNKQLQQKSQRFINRTKDTFEFQKTSKKLNSFYSFDFKTFLAELKKQKTTLSLHQQDEWEDYFTKYKTEITHLQTQITQTDNEIDQMVYELYGLTDEEIRVVEGGQ
ncbi:MAG: N-6 DNA methylase, partial [Proteobacteria bacterium]|nr:N-6 DNA methylase [Pseudomonadota bacterium]